MPTNYESSGGVRVNGCAGFASKRNFPVRFSPGDRVWIERKARRGRAESVVLSRIHVNEVGGGFVVVCVDTFNRVWLEHELVGQGEAEALLDAYRRDELDRVRSFYASGACFPIKPEACG